jgi:lysophospholipid acyltransferase (LPLAT)-like uncharacterized protein
MKLRHPWAIRIAAFFAAGLIRLWMGTVRYRFAGSEAGAHPADPRVGRFIYAFWHESLLVPTILKTTCRILSSQHADGELMAQVCRRLGFQVVRGSTTRGGVSALLELTTGGQAAHVAFTPDGPRGPRRRVQLGTVALASLTGLPIVAFGVGFSRAWRARSWDRFAVPRPFSTAFIVTAPVLHVPANLDREGLECHRLFLEQRLLDATATAESWAESGVEPTADAVGNVPSHLKASA